MTPDRVQRQRVKGWRTPLCACGCGRPAIYVGRPSNYGNPYKVGTVFRDYEWESLHFAGRGSAWPHGIIDLGPIEAVRKRIADRGLLWFVDEVRSQRQAVNLFRVWVEWAQSEEPDETEEWLSHLSGHDLMCWCPLEDGNGNRVPCHADVLLELANGGAE